jgi:hypothetical protein
MIAGSSSGQYMVILRHVWQISRYTEISEPISAIHVMQQRQRAICKYISLFGDIAEALLMEVRAEHVVPSNSFDSLYSTMLQDTEYTNGRVYRIYTQLYKSLNSRYLYINQTNKEQSTIKA